MSQPVLHDHTGREIKPGDILKVYHFTGARRKRHYMYKQALEYTMRGNSWWLKISHLNRLNDEPWEIGKNYYLEPATGWLMACYEIVHSIECDHEKRPRA